jgi:hypothetical protein
VITTRYFNNFVSQKFKLIWAMSEIFDLNSLYIFSYMLYVYVELPHKQYKM